MNFICLRVRKYKIFYENSNKNSISVKDAEFPTSIVIISFQEVIRHVKLIRNILNTVNAGIISCSHS